MRPGTVYQRGRFRVITETYRPCPQSSPPPLSPPSDSSCRTGFIPWLPPPSGLPSRPPDGQPFLDRPAFPPDRQQLSSFRQPDDPRNTDQNLPAADAPRLSQKRKQSRGHLARGGEQNLAPPVTRTPPGEDSRRLRKKPTKKLAGKGVQEQHPTFVQTSQPEQQQQPPIFQSPQPQPQQQFSPFPSFVQHPLIFQTLQPQLQQQQFSSFPSFVQQFSPFSPLIFQSFPQMGFSFSTQLQQQLPSLFQTPQLRQQQHPSIFQTPQPQQQQQQPSSYNTRFEDLHPDLQKLLLQIEERILEYMAESKRLDQCIQLYDSSVSSDSFELDASCSLQTAAKVYKDCSFEELGGITTAIEREKVSVQDLMKKVNDMMRHMEFAIHSYMMLRPRFLHPNVLAALGTGSASHTVGAAGTSGQTDQLMTNPISPIFEFYSGIPIRPSPFMHHIAARFEKSIMECCQWIEELEQLILMDTDKTSSNSLEALPRLMPNIYDYFILVAAKVENLHQFVESMKMAYLADRRRLGDGNDPFLEASGREAAKQEAAARRVHPTLHLLANSAQPATQAAGIFASSAASL